MIVGVEGVKRGKGERAGLKVTISKPHGIRPGTPQSTMMDQTTTNILYLFVSIWNNES